jgi:adenosylmethionine-8-amino-7-oxononanoate aminotransferase
MLPGNEQMRKMPRHTPPLGIPAAMSSNSDFVRRDLRVLWHPCTQMKDHEWLPLIPVRRGQGVWLEDFEGKRYLDAISSWWVNLFGHANPRINAALARQAETLEHVILAGFSHEAVVELSERLVQIAPPGLTRCFYADNGSSAVEVTLKMSFHYWRNLGQHKKKRFINLSNSYHGETLGALAVGDEPLYKQTYQPLLMDVITVPSPDCFECEAGESWETHTQRMFAHMEQALAQHHEEVCAVILEPLVQCAGNMRMYHPVYLKLLREACNRYGVHLIADEIAVGFGRTGTLFACEQAGITPDFLPLSKGLTGGYLPLSVVMTHEKIYQAFYDDYTKLTAFLHSHSYTGNALGCRAALATLDIFRDDDVIVKNKVLAAHMQKAAAPLVAHPHVAEVRQHGMILAIELVEDKARRTPYAWQERRGLRVYQHALTRGVLLRPMGDVIYFMPPYVITPDEINLMAQVAAEGIDLATCEA